jgi:hypothetical protein
MLSLATWEPEILRCTDFFTQRQPYHHIDFIPYRYHAHEILPAEIPHQPAYGHRTPVLLLLGEMKLLKIISQFCHFDQREKSCDYVGVLDFFITPPNPLLF